MANYNFSQEDANANKGMGILMSVFPFLFFLPLVVENQKNSEYLKFRANQSLIILICSVACSILSYIPVIKYVAFIIRIAVFVFAIINLVNACQASDKPLPLIGDIKIL